MFTGHLTDASLIDTAAKMEFANDADVLDSMNYWFNDKRLEHAASSDLLKEGVDVVAANLATKRGELKVAGRGAKYRAFVTKVVCFSISHPHATHMSMTEVPGFSPPVYDCVNYRLPRELVPVRAIHSNQTR